MTHKQKHTLTGKSALAVMLLFLAFAPQIAILSPGNTYAKTKNLSLTAQKPIFETFNIKKAHAAEDVIMSTPIGGGVQKFFAGGLNIIVVLNWLALSWVQTLLRPDAIFGNVAVTGKFKGVRPIEYLLKNIWITSRNIVNGIFAFVLLAGGIYMIVKAGEEGMSAIKQKIPKFVLAVILVNFSWFFPRVLIDASNILTSTIFNLPSLVTKNFTCYEDLGKDGKIGGKGENADIPCKYVWDVKLFPCDDLKKGEKCVKPTPNATGKMRGKAIGNFVHIYYENWNKVAKTRKSHAGKVSGADIVVNGLAANFAKLSAFGTLDFQKLKIQTQFSTKISEQALAHLKFLIYMAIHIIFGLAVMLPLLAFGFVLIARIVVLWICIGFMPFIFLGWAIGGNLGQLSVGGGEGAPNIWQKFIMYTFLPTLVAVPYAIGFTLISSLYNLRSMGISMSLHGLDVFPGIRTDQELLWMAMAIGIIWMGTFMVLERDKMAASFTSTIKGIGQAGLKSAAYAGLYAPIPMPGGGAMSVGGVKDRILNLPSAIKFGGLGGASGRNATPAPAPPPPDSDVQTVGTGFNNAQFRDLKNILKNTKSNNAADQLNAFANRLSQISQSTSRPLSVTEARGIATHRESLLQLLNAGVRRRTITEQEKDEMMDKAKLFQGSARVDIGGSVRINVSHATDAKSTQSQIASQSANYLSSGVGADAVINALRRYHDGEAATANEKRITQGIIDKIEELRRGDNSDEQIAAELNRISSKDTSKNVRTEDTSGIDTNPTINFDVRIGADDTEQDVENKVMQWANKYIENSAFDKEQVIEVIRKNKTQAISQVAQTGMQNAITRIQESM